MKQKFPIIIFLVSLFWFTAPESVAQQNIQGRIVDNEENPLIGATIIVKSASHIGTVTDIDGNFFLSLDQALPVTLTASLIGYKSQEIDVYDSREPIYLILPENLNLLNEIVVTALGISREKKSLGYTTQEIKSNEIENTKESNIVNALSGKVAGVRVTNSQGDMGSSRIVIRGETSIAGNNQPLFIVDGIPVDNSQYSVGGATRDFRNAIADLNAEDIESISVLKGPNAAALYGSRAAQGVVLITTKSGKGQKGIGISVNTGVSFSRIATLAEFQNVFGQGTNGQFSYIDGKGGGLNDGVDESWGPKMDGRLIPQFHSNGEAVPFVAHPNNVKDFFNTGVLYDNGISIAGSDDKFDFRLGLNNQKQLGTVPNTEINKTNISVNANYQLTKRIKVGTTANYIISDAPNLPGGSSGARAAGVMLEFLWFGRQVDINELKKDYSHSWNDSYYSNPYWRAYYNTTSQKRNRLIGDVHLDVNLAKGLDFRFRTGTDYYNDRRKYKIKYGTSGTPYGSYAEDAYTVNENNTETILHYTKDLSKYFSFDILGGYNVRNRTYENNYQRAPRLAVPDLYTLTNSRDQLESSNEYSRLRVHSAFGSAQLGFRNYAYLNVTARNDWSSTLPSSNRSYFYPSVNASLVLSEAFNIQSRTLNLVKIRGGWSEVGSDADPYQLATVYNFQTAFEGNPIQTSSKKKLNANLKPETTRSVEFGAEISLLQNRIHLDVAYYNTNSLNQILEVQTSAASGYTSQLLNAGKINNQGWEVQLDLTPVQIKKFRWDIGVNYARNKSQVKELDKEGLIENYTIATSGNVDVLAAVGEKYGALYGTAYLKDDDGNIIVDQNGLPRADPQKKILGYYTPGWLGGLSNTFTYKNIQLSFLIDASIGGKIYSGTNRIGDYTGVLKQTLTGRDADHGGLLYYYADDNTSGSKILLNGNSISTGSTVYEDGMIFPGVNSDGTPNTTVISAQQYYKASYNISEAYIYSSSYIKFREIKLIYNLDKVVKKIGIQGASVSLVGRNLFFLYKKVPNIDPESALNTGNGQGLESYALPTTRSFGFNINVKI